MDKNAIVSLVFTVVAIVFVFFLAWFVTRLVGGRVSPGGQGRHIRILEKTAVSKESAIFIAEICGKMSVIGMTPQGMTVLRELSEEEAAGVRPAAAPAGTKGFAQAMQDALDNSLPQGRVKDTVDKMFRKKGDGEPK